MQIMRNQWISLAFLVGMILILEGVRKGEALPPPICNEQKVPLSPYAQKLCAALSNISDFSRAMEEYLDAKLIRNSIAVNEPEVKRQDLDHVFLRFGRTQQ